MFSKKFIWTVVVIILVFALISVVGLWRIRRASYQTNIVTPGASNQPQATQKTVSPFKADNPLKDVQANPFTKIKSLVNPFK